MGKFTIKIEKLAEDQLKKHLKSGNKASIKKIEQIFIVHRIMTIRIIQLELVTKIGRGTYLHEINPLHVLHRPVDFFARRLASLLPHGHGFGLSLTGLGRMGATDTGTQQARTQ